MSKKDSIKKLDNLIAFLMAGLDEANKLRSELEGDSSPSSRNGGLDAHQKLSLMDKRKRTFKKNAISC